MSDVNQLRSISRSGDGEHAGFTVQSTAGNPPSYSDALYRLYYSHESAIQISLNTQPLVVKKGSLLTLSPGEGVEFGSSTSVKSLCFHHDFFCVRVRREEVFCDGIVFNQLTGLPIVEFPEQEQKSLHDRFDQLNELLSNPSLLMEERVVNGLRDLLLHAAENKIANKLAAEGRENIPTPISSLVLDFQRLVEESYDQRQPVSYYADALHVTNATLNRHVKSELGQSVTEVVNERLAVAAREALRDGKKSIKVVAHELGFDDPLYFSRFFRKHFGLPPSNYFQHLADGDKDTL